METSGEGEQLVKNEREKTLAFIGQDPGAVRHGNFINYYAFHPVSERVMNFPRDIWTLPPVWDKPLICLDVGCNSGELTKEMHSLISSCLRCEGENPSPKMRTLGIDLDPQLVQRAQECNSHTSNVEFICTDVMTKAADTVLEDFLTRSGVTQFGIVFLMSVTMWVHLVQGDAALRTLLLRCARLTERWLVLEPQPWSCYRSAQRRLVKSGDSGFPLYSKLMIKGPQLHEVMHKFLTEECAMVRVHETEPTRWGRTTSVYQKL